jgi:hypothetical protein
VTGEYYFASGVDVADWAILGLFLPPEKDGDLPNSRLRDLAKGGLHGR